MNPRTVCCFILMIAAQWYVAETYRDADRRSLPLRDSNSRHRCCGGDRYEGSSEFRQQIYSDRRLDHDPSFTKHRQDYHIHSNNHHRYHDDYYYRPNGLKYFDYKSPSSKNSYHKGYYTRRYNTPYVPETKYIQKRVGFVFPDTHNNINDGRGGYRPYVPDSNFQHHRYHENENGFNNFRNKNGDQGYHELPDDRYRQKYRPGLLGVSVGSSGAVVATGPDGYKHVIHNLPPWTELNITPNEHYPGSFPENMDPRGGLESPGGHRFPTGFHENLGIYNNKNHHHQNKGMPVYLGSSDSTPHTKNNSYFVAIYKESHNKNKNQEQGPPKKNTSDILHQTDELEEQRETAPPKFDKFRPSLPFYRYSEPDPLYHPNGSPLQTYSYAEPTQPPTIPSKISTSPNLHKTTLSPASAISPKYPDSINAQLPPPAHDTDTRVPYVAATAVTEQTPNQPITAATQASEATHKKSLIQVLPTQPSEPSSTDSEVSSSTLQNIKTSTAEENKIVLPTSLYQEISTHSAPTEISLHLSQPPQTENSIKTEYFLPTITTEESNLTYQSTESQISSTTELSHSIINLNIEPISSPQESSNFMNKSDVKQTPDTNNTKHTENKNSNIYVTPLQSSSNPHTSTIDLDSGLTVTLISTETNKIKTQISSSTTELVEENSDLIQTLKPDSEDMHPIFETDKTEQVTENDNMDTIPSETKLHVESIVTKPAPSMLNQLQTLVNHARSLTYFQRDSNTTVKPTDESD